MNEDIWGPETGTAFDNTDSSATDYDIKMNIYDLVRSANEDYGIEVEEPKNESGIPIFRKITGIGNEEEYWREWGEYIEDLPPELEDKLTDPKRGLDNLDFVVSASIIDGYRIHEHQVPNEYSSILEGGKMEEYIEELENEIKGKPSDKVEVSEIDVLEELEDLGMLTTEIRNINDPIAATSADYGLEGVKDLSYIYETEEGLQFDTDLFEKLYKYEKVEPEEEYGEKTSDTPSDPVAHEKPDNQESSRIPYISSANRDRYLNRLNISTPLLPNVSLPSPSIPNIELSRGEREKDRDYFSDDPEAERPNPRQEREELENRN